MIDCIKYMPFNSAMKLRNFCYRFVLNEMGENCNICDGVSILYTGNVSIGNRVSIHEYTLIGGRGKIKIGNNVAIAHDCSIVSESHNFSDMDILIKDQGLTTEPIFIGNDVWLGCKVVVLGNVTIGNGSVIGAGSVVTKNIPENTIAVGNPCRVIRFRKNDE
jgi:acetyltransferase-like isoleucine patch superfamily enzyme